MARSRVLVNWLPLDGVCRLVTETPHDHSLLLSEVMRAGACLHAISRGDSADQQQAKFLTSQCSWSSRRTSRRTTMSIPQHTIWVSIFAPALPLRGPLDVRPRAKATRRSFGGRMQQSSITRTAMCQSVPLPKLRLGIVTVQPPNPLTPGCIQHHPWGHRLCARHR
jgi:hypothetical protein